MAVLRIWAILFLSCAVLLSHSNQAFAQKKTITWNEQGVLAYYKITGRKNDFEKKIRNSKGYDDMPKDAAEQYLQEELLRLQWGLGTFDPDKDFLTLKTSVQTSIIENEGKYYLASNFEGRSAMDPPYFPYNMFDMWVALMLRDIDKFMLLEITEEQKNRIEGYLPKDQEKHEVALEIVYRVSSGDPEPIMLDGVEQHMMLGDIAKFAMVLPVFHQSQDLTLWEYIAPWYLTNDEQDLLKILEGR